MAEPVKIKFEYQDPINVEAEVPGAQKIREVEPDTNENQNTSSNGENSKDNPESSESIISYTEVRSEVVEDGNVVTRHRKVISGKRNGIHGEPVMMEDKQQEDKRTRTKIPVSRFRQTVERVKAERRGARDKGEHESHIPVRRSSIPKPVKDHKQPTTVKKEVAITKSEIRKEVSEPTITKIQVIRKESSEPTATKTEETNEPEDEFDKIFAEIVNTPTEVVFDESLLNPKVEDPQQVESKFEEIIHDYDENKVQPIDVEVVRRSRIPYLTRRSQQDVELSAQADRTSKIIAARDKLRRKHHSLTREENFEDELDKELRKEQAEADAVKTTVKAEPTGETRTEKETKHEVISSPNSKTEITRHFTKTISTSSSQESESVSSSSVVETTTVKEVKTNESNDKKENKQQVLTEENIVKDSIKIGIPVFNSYTHEFSENNETAKTVEVKRVLSYISNNEDLSVSNNITEVKSEIGTVDNGFEQVSSTKEIKSHTYSETFNDESVTHKTETKDQEPNKHKETNADDVQLRCKVGKLVTKIDSKEVIETETNKRESINELTKKKSVLSKIAMFEKKEPEETVSSTALRRQTKPPKLITKDWQKVDHVHVHTPLIVDEVFKPFQADIDLNNKDNNVESLLKSEPEYTTIIRAERVTVESPDSVHYSTENGFQMESKPFIQDSNVVEKPIPVKTNMNSEYCVQKVEIATITNVLPSKDFTISNDLTPPRKGLDTNESSNQLAENESTSRPNIAKSVDNQLPSNILDNEVRDVQTKTERKTRLSVTKELQAPIIIPGFKPVSELLRSFESKKENRSPKRTVSKIEYVTSTVVAAPVKIEVMSVNEIIAPAETYTEAFTESYDDFEPTNDYKSLDDVFSKESDYNKFKFKQEEELKRAKSLAELDLGDAVKGKVNNMILRMRSVDRMELDRREVINQKEMPRKRSVSEKIALFEGKLTPAHSQSTLRLFKQDRTEAPRTEKKIENSTRTDVTTKYSAVEINIESKINERTGNYSLTTQKETENSVTEAERSSKSDEEVIQKTIEELRSAKLTYGKVDNMPGVELSNGLTMPVLAVGTALMDSRLTVEVVKAAIDLGYRAIDSGYIYGNEGLVGEAVKAKIADGTVRREDLFIISKLWSTYHRSDLVEVACRASLAAMGLDYFDLYLIHNPMSFKEGGAPIPKIATVIQYSEHDYLDAWYGMEGLITKGLARAIGVSNFNSAQLQRVLDKGRFKPVVNQVECHPYLSQQRLEQFCSERNVSLSCYGVLGSKGTPQELKTNQAAVIDDALVQVLASGLGVSPAQMLISYQLENGHGVVVKSSSAAHLWDNLQALNVHLTSGQVDALHALNRNKRTFSFRGMGDTHRNYPFNTAY